MPTYDQKVMDQILSLPSGVQTLAGPQQIAEFVVARCRRIPGVAEALFCHRGTCLASEGMGTQPPKSCQEAFAASGTAACPRPCPLDTGSTIRLGLNGARLCFGGVLLQVDSPRAFAPYRVLLESTINQVALLMENHDQAASLDSFHSELERRVADRTKELREKNAELEDCFTHSLDLLCIADTDGRLRRLNPQWEATLGYSRDEHSEWPFLELVLPEDRAATIATMQALAENRPVHGFVNRYRTKDGGVRWLEWDSHTAGKLIYTVAHDITERQRPEAAPEAALRGRETILFAEDEATLRRLGTQILERHGYRVLPCGEVAEALATARQFAGPIDLLVTDIVMPGGNGRLLAEKLRQLRPQLKVLYVSGYTADVLGETGVLNDGLHFLPKPYGPAELLARLRQILTEPAVGGPHPVPGRPGAR